MSKPRFNWWGTAMNIIRDYPQRKRDYDDLKEQKITADLSGMPGGGSGTHRVVEGLALRQLPYQEQKEYDAVHRALELTKGMEDGKKRCEVVELAFWKGLTIRGIAVQAYMSERTARRYRWEFVLLVGREYGSIDNEEYQRALKKLH